MSSLRVGGKVQVTSAIPGFYLRKGTITSIMQPFIEDERAQTEALRELRLYVVRLEDGRHFRFRGNELTAAEGATEERRNASHLLQYRAR